MSSILDHMVIADIQKRGSMQENYNAETGEGLAQLHFQLKQDRVVSCFSLYAQV